MKLIVSIIACLGWVSILPNVSLGSFVLSLENVTVNAGSRASVGVFVSSVDGDALTAYNLPIDVGNNGFGMPAGFTFAPGDFAQEVDTFGTVLISGTVAPGGAIIQNFDVVFTASGPDLSLTTPRRLFNILIDTSPALTPGTSIPIAFNSNSSVPNLYSVSTRNGGTVFTVPLNSTNGSITIAVPEPSSITLLGIAVLGLWTIRRRMR